MVNDDRIETDRLDVVLNVVNVSEGGVTVGCVMREGESRAEGADKEVG